MAEPRQLVPAKTGPRDHHHRVAYLVATGVRTGEVARTTGMSVQRVCYLKTLDWFQELTRYYKDKAEAIEFEAYERVMVLRAHIEELALEALRDILEETPELVPVRDLQEIQGDMADRLGRGKVQRNESVSMNIDLADSLAEARRRELRLSASQPERDAEGGRLLRPAEGPVPAN